MRTELRRVPFRILPSAKGAPNQKPVMYHVPRSMKQMLHSQRHRSRVPLAAISLIFFLHIALFAGLALSQVTLFPFPGDKPPDAPAAWKRLIGEYGIKEHFYDVLEKSGSLYLRENDSSEALLRTESESDGAFSIYNPSGPLVRVFFHFTQGTSNPAGSVSIDSGTFHRRRLGLEEGQAFRITPERPVDELRKAALASEPPHERGTFRKPELVELVSLDPAIHLDIRYATSDDFLGTPVYTQARAFLQRPAADALLRALRRLQPYGYALLIHDAYRPWYVTKIFWDATPPEGKIFVADPAQGSRHNRGCAVDLTLYELKTGKPVQMPGTYDEMSPRSFPDYPGGTSLQRWHRDLLRWAMESEGFTVYDHEWWHFDYKDWREYPILNVPFEGLQFSKK
jgi:D-alanyl-D-alanine dipeptidase